MSTKPLPMPQLQARTANRPTGLALLRSFRRHWQLLLLLAPALVHMIVFHYFPMAGVAVAFKDYNLIKGIWGSEWVGLQHFERLFASNDIKQILYNTVKISLLSLVVGFPAPILFALFLNEIRLMLYKRVVQTFVYLPHFFNWVIISALLTYMLSPISGPVNAILGWFGIEPISFLTSKDWFIPVLIGSNIWKEIGWSSIIYLAAISGINPALYEAAVMDGASRFRQMFSITLPCILPTIMILLILRVGNILDSNFDQIFNMYNASVMSIADVIDTYIVRIGIGQLDYGVPAALGVFKGVIGLILVVAANHIVKRVKDSQHGLY